MHICVHMFYGMCVIVYPPQKQGPEETRGSQTRTIHSSEHTSHHQGGLSSFPRQLGHCGHVPPTAPEQPCTGRGQEIPQWVQVSAWDVSD